MTQETPAKVFSLLGAAMFSMFLLFGVSVSNASFNQTEVALPDIFAPSNVLSVLDNTSKSYSNFLAANLFQPLQQDYAIAQDNINYLTEEAGPSILAITGFDALIDMDSEYTVPASQVAGAFTKASQSLTFREGFNVDNLYSLIIE
jgi:hypothetical protein